MKDRDNVRCPKDWSKKDLYELYRCFAQRLGPTDFDPRATAWREQLRHNTSPLGWRDANILLGYIEVLEAAAREALALADGGHNPDCKIQQEALEEAGSGVPIRPRSPCNCGFDALRAVLEGKEKP